MKTSFLRLVLPLAALAFVVPGSAFAQKGKGGGDSGGGEPAPASGPIVIPGGSHTECYVVSVPGSYLLGGNRVMTDSNSHNILITSRDVTLDLGGFALSHIGTGDGAGIRIESTENVEIRNGSIVAAAYNGVSASVGKGLRLLDLRVVAPAHNGIYSQASGTLLERCHVIEAGDEGIELVDSFNVVVDSSVLNSASYGLRTGKFSRAARSVVRGGSHGVDLGEGSTLEDSSVTGASHTGIFAQGHTTIRNCQITHNNVKGVSILLFNGTALFGNRFAANPLNVSGTYLNGGGNLLP